MRTLPFTAVFVLCIRGAFVVFDTMVAVIRHRVPDVCSYLFDSHGETRT